TLLSALAPGASLIGAKTALNVLRSKKRPHRLLVPNALRFAEIAAGFEASWRVGAVTTTDAQPPGDWTAARTRIVAEMQALVDDAACERVIELATPALQSDEKQRQRGLRL